MKRKKLLIRVACVLLAMALPLVGSAATDQRGVDRTCGRHGFEAKEDLRGNQALPSSARRGDIDAVEAAISDEVPLETRDRFGMTALLNATECGHLEIAESLVDAGADVDARDPGGRTSLHIVVDHGYPAIIPVLMKAGPDLNLVDRAGRTPVQAARQAFGTLEAATERFGKDARALLALLDGKSLPAALARQRRELENRYPVGKDFTACDGPGCVTMRVSRDLNGKPIAVTSKITVGQFKACADAGACKRRMPTWKFGKELGRVDMHILEFYKSGNKPSVDPDEVAHLSYREILDFAAWMTSKSKVAGRKYRPLDFREYREIKLQEVTVYRAKLWGIDPYLIRPVLPGVKKRIPKEFFDIPVGSLSRDAAALIRLAENLKGYRLLAELAR